ncbi:hypothetical protein ACNHKD_12115 [Methylocystis sp. JAN1]|uniref:hypothetical protein n=1 Tax=Methylocystis sp. JAN1 TaxID=3397211 RepID=UPI003FA32218
MSARETSFARLSILALGVGLFIGAPAAAAGGRTHFLRATGPTREGPWLQEGWDREDWSRSPVRGWAFSAPWDFDPVTLYPSTTEWYPWGYTTPFVRVGRQCVSSEINGGVNGEWIRYQRVRPSYYCR